MYEIAPSPLYQNNQTERIVVENIIIQRVDGFCQQYGRPYQLHYNGNALDQLRERCSQYPHLSLNAFAGVAGQMLQPEAAPERKIEIVNGWGQARFRFMMKVRVVRQLGTSIELVFGYTDHDGINMNTGSIDPNLQFFVNSVSTVQVARTHSLLGSGEELKPFETSHVIADNNFQGIYDSPSINWNMRPMDLYHVMSNHHTGGDIDRRNVYDVRSLNYSTPQKSRASNNLSASYMRSVLSSFRSAQQLDALGQPRDTFYENALSPVKEDTVASDIFMKSMSQLRGQLTNNFSYHDLMMLDPELQMFESERVSVIRVPNVVTQQHNMYIDTNPFNSSDWADATNEAHKATILSQTVPSLLMECGLLHIAFTSTNKTPNGQLLTIPMSSATFGGGREEPLVQLFIQQFELQIVPDITDMMYPFELSMVSDVAGQSTINLQLNDGEYYNFVSPTFCGALQLPVVTTNSNRLNDIALSMENICNEVVGVTTELVDDYKYDSTWL